MNFSFEAIFLIAFGTISLIAGLLKKKILFWTTFKQISFKKQKEPKYSQVINLTMGLLSIIIGLYLLMR